MGQCQYSYVTSRLLPQVFGSSPSDSDAWEFQENEFMNARERLRLIRAKLAVLEGKMTLAMMSGHVSFILIYIYFRLDILTKTEVPTVQFQ